MRKVGRVIPGCGCTPSVPAKDVLTHLGFTKERTAKELCSLVAS